MPEHKLPGANFYPESHDQGAIRSWVKTLAPKQQKQAKGFFTVIRVRRQERLKIVPYSEAYKADLTPSGEAFEGSRRTHRQRDVETFLTTRAAAFLSNDYYESDVAWMDLDAPLDITIGPYETYNDELFGYKASYEAYVNVRDEQESAKLGAFAKHLQEIENNLPHRSEVSQSEDRGAGADPRGQRGDERGRRQSRRADRGLQPAQRRASGRRKGQQARHAEERAAGEVQADPGSDLQSACWAATSRTEWSFEAFFTHILAHELCHGLGPHQITVNGKPTTPREQLKELYSAIEEAKADATGLFALQYMIDHAQAMGLADVLKPDRSSEKQLYTTYLASSFRTLRFGMGEAHGKGMAVQLNYLMDKGAFVTRPDGTFAVDYTKIKDAVRDLTHDLLTVEAEGDYAGAKKMLGHAWACCVRSSSRRWTSWATFRWTSNQSSLRRRRSRRTRLRRIGSDVRILG